jgi:hypothetical protein
MSTQNLSVWAILFYEFIYVNVFPPTRREEERRGENGNPKWSSPTLKNKYLHGKENQKNGFQNYCFEKILSDLRSKK